MRAELVSIPTSTIPLDGLYYEPEGGAAAGAALLFHGNTMNFYTGALRLDLSIENQYGIFNDRLNLSQAIDAAGDAPAARQQLEILLTDKTFPLGAEQRARAYAGLALLFLKQGETGEAERMIGEARHSCGTACPNLGAILNIQARIELERGNPASALASAGASLPLLADADQLSERANAWRIIGQARLARNETTSAIEGLQQALALDRELGKPERIVDDLMLLGRAYATSGNADRAGDFFRRALSVAEATADPALMKRVGELPGINRPQSSDH